MRRRFERSALATAVAAVGCWSGVAAGAGFQLQEQNVSGLGTAYSGQAAAAEDASTVYWNPAGLTRIKGRQAVGAIHGINPSAEFSNTGSTAPAAGIPLGNNGGDAGGWAWPAPVNAYLSWETLPDRLWLGLGINTPFGLKTEWDSAWVGRFHAIKSEVKSININPSVAWKVNERVSVGAGINAMRFEATLTNAVAYGASILGAAQQAGLSVGQQAALSAAIGGTTAEGTGQVQGDSWGWGWNLGVMFNITPMTRLGIHYRSQIKQKLEGDVEFQNAPVVPAAFGAFATQVNASFANGNIDATVKLPDTATIGLSHNFSPRLQVLADFTWTGWSSIDYLSIYRDNGSGLTSTPLKFDDSWRIGVGANYQLNDQWKLRFGVAYDKTPVQDAFRTPRLPDSDRYWLAIGAQYAVSKRLAIDVGYAHLFADDASSNLPNVDTDLPSGFRGSPKGALVGEYNASVNILSAGLRYSF